MEHGHFTFMFKQKWYNQRSFAKNFLQLNFFRFKSFDNYRNEKTRVSESFSNVFSSRVTLCFAVLFKSIYLFILLRKIFEMIPLAALKVLETLIFIELLSQDIFNRVFDLILKFEFIFLSHLHFNSLCSFLIFITQNLLLVKRFGHIVFIGHILKIIFIV